MNTKTISTIQAKAPLTGATLLAVSANGPCVVFDIEGNVNSTTGTNYYIQLLGTANPSTGVTIPLYSRLVVPGNSGSGINGFSFTYRPLGLDTAKMANPAGGTLATQGVNTLPVYIAISSTDTVWTSVAANTDVSVTIEDEFQDFDIPNQTITGSLSNSVDSLTVFADPNAAKRLTQFVVKNTNGSTCYLMLFAYANPTTGALPLAQWTVANNATITEKFGGGWPMMQQNASYVNHTGCYLFGSSTTQTLTATSATSWSMQAFNI